MEHYFFDVFNGNGLEVDREGQHLASREHMRRLAISTLTRIANEEFPTTDQRHIEITVRDAQGKKVFYSEINLRTEEIT